MVYKNIVYKNIEELPSTLNVNDVASFLNISRAYAYKLVHTEGFPILKIGTRLVVPKEPFVDWIKHNTGK